MNLFPIKSSLGGTGFIDLIKKTNPKSHLNEIEFSAQSSKRKWKKSFKKQHLRKLSGKWTGRRYVKIVSTHFLYKFISPPTTHANPITEALLSVFKWNNSGCS